MGKRAASLQPGCITVCLDRPVDSKPGVLCSIENIVANQKHVVDGLKSPAAKKQRCLELEQDPAAPKPLDVSFVFSKARSLLRQPPPGADDAPIGREKQSKQLEDLVTSFSNGSSGKSVYVSGLPGTGERQKYQQHMIVAVILDQQQCACCLQRMLSRPQLRKALLVHCLHTTPGT